MRQMCNWNLLDSMRNFHERAFIAAVSVIVDGKMKWTLLPVLRSICEDVYCSVTLRSAPSSRFEVSYN